MFGIGGFNPINLLATAALGPIGGLVAQLAQQVMSQFGQQILQQMGQQLGLPQGVIDDAKGIFNQQFAGGAFAGQGGSLSDSIEQFGQAAGGTPQQIGQLHNDAQSALDNINNDIAQGTGEVNDSKGSGKAPGWLMAMAKVLGAKMDKMANDMDKMANEIAGGSAGKSSEFTALAQQFGMISNAAGTAIKAVGEAMSNMARKQ